MKTEWNLTETSFHKLLRWLDEDQARAADRYEEIREGLIRVFVRRGCYCAEDLADNTINRVAQKLDHINDYEGNKALYFYAVAKLIEHEFRRKQKVIVPPAPAHSPEEKERRSDCLERCLKDLPPENRAFILKYYEKDGSARIAHRKQMIEEMGIDLHLLRVRISRIKLPLAKCVCACMKESEEK